MSTHYDLLLIGAGHAHLGVLRRWALVERPPGRIALLSAGPVAWYSGMLPGLLAGRHRPEDCQVELQALCRAAKATMTAFRRGRARMKCCGDAKTDIADSDRFYQ